MHCTRIASLQRLGAGLALVGLAIGASPAYAQQAATTPPPVTGPGLATAVARQANLEGRVMWMDGTANLKRLSTREGVSEVFEKCRKANINTVVVDVKPLSGHVLYNSKIAPRLQEWRGFQYPQGYDLLLTAMIEGRRRGMKVYAGINCFSEGHKLVKSGPLYEKPELQSIVYDVERTVATTDGGTYTLAIGENTGPLDGQIVSFDMRWTEWKKLGPLDAAAVVREGKITAVIDGALAGEAGLNVPVDGYLLIGRGTGAKWLLEHCQVDQQLTYTAKEVLQPILEAPSETVAGFVNPARPESRAYLIQLVEEIADNYAVDGIVFDRMRYASLRTDFSPFSREQFEAWLGKKLDRFPQDIYAYSAEPGKPLVLGPYYKEWLEWRARNVSGWLDEAREAVNRKRPGLSLGVYVGSWYDKYYSVGVNWGASDFSPRYDWMTESYPSTGYAGKINWLCTGCYYTVATRGDARQLGLPEDMTVEAAAETSVRAVNDASFVYASLNLPDYRGRPEEFRRALQTAVANSQGVMLFDLVYIEMYNWWNILSEAFSVPKRAPHDVPGLQEGLQQTKKALQQPAAAGS
jgi:uncharacterized lipoprotein YddW (UPF0748 family)